MRFYKDIQETKEILEFIECDKCHKKYDDIMDLQEFIFIHLTGGYNSAFGDGDEYQCDLCSNCAKELLMPYLQYMGNRQ